MVLIIWGLLGKSGAFHFMDDEHLKLILEELGNGLESLQEHLGIKLYKLTPEKIPVPCSMQEFGEQMHKIEERKVGLDVVGPYEISTVFLGLDHQWDNKGLPRLFETMIFAEEDGKRRSVELVNRYATYELALEGHRNTVARVTDEVKQDMN